MPKELGAFHGILPNVLEFFGIIHGVLVPLVGERRGLGWVWGRMKERGREGRGVEGEGVGCG